jgi:hypothetical protein
MSPAEAWALARARAARLRAEAWAEAYARGEEV